MVEINVKDDFLLKSEVLHASFVYKGKYLKILKILDLNLFMPQLFIQLLNLLYLFARLLHTFVWTFQSTPHPGTSWAILWP